MQIWRVSDDGDRDDDNFDNDIIDDDDTNDVMILHAASSMAESINFDVDPCEDFYEFACGKWIETNVIPEDKSAITIMSVLHGQIEIGIKSKYYVVSAMIKMLKTMTLNTLGGQ